VLLREQPCSPFCVASWLNEYCVLAMQMGKLPKPMRVYFSICNQGGSQEGGRCTVVRLCQGTARLPWEISSFKQAVWLLLV
jgi:hypothetical protein